MAFSESITDENAVRVARAVFERTTQRSVVEFKDQRSYADNRCGTCNDCFWYSATLECFAADDFCCCQTDESLMCLASNQAGNCVICRPCDFCCLSFCPWRKEDSNRLHLKKSQYRWTPLQLACKNEKVELATIIFEKGANIWFRLQADGYNNGGIIHQLAASTNQDQSLKLFQMFAAGVKEQNQEFAYSPEKLSDSEQTGKVKTKWPDRSSSYKYSYIPACRRSHLAEESFTVQKLKGITKTYLENRENATPQELAQKAIAAEMDINPSPAHATVTEETTGAPVTWIMLRGGNGWHPLTVCKIKGATVDDADVGKKNFHQIHWLDFRDSRGKTPIDVAHDNGHTTLEHAMIFERHPAYTDGIIRDASACVSQLCIQDALSQGGGKRRPASKPMPIEDHIKTHGADLSSGLLQIASRCICKSARHMEPAAVQTLKDELTTRIQEVLGNPDDLSLDVPLPRQLNSIKQLLLDYVQVPLYYGDCTIAEIPLAFRDAIFTPLVEIIRHHCAILLEKVRLHPDHFVNIVAELAIPDARSYDAQRLKAMSKIFGNGKQQFDTMLKGVDGTYGECTAQTASRNDSIVQPTGDPLKLTVLLRNATPGFKAAVNAMATLHIRESANGLLKDDRSNPEIVILTFRPMCKGLYRIIEKCLLKSKAQDTLNTPIDCSKVKDAAGCFISCTNFKTMHDVMNAIYNNDQWKVCELKNTWTGLSKAGWRDYKVIVQFGGLLFEIQIALEHMVRARNFLDGHAAYAAFRNYYECIKYLGGHEERLTNAVSPDTLGVSHLEGAAADAAHPASHGASNNNSLQTLARPLRLVPVAKQEAELIPALPASIAIDAVDAVNRLSAVGADTQAASSIAIDPLLPPDEKLHIMRQMLSSIQVTAFNMEKDELVEEITALHDHVASLHSPNFKNENSLRQCSQQTSL